MPTKLVYHCLTCDKRGLSVNGKNSHRKKGHIVVWDKDENGKVKKLKYSTQTDDCYR